MYLQCNGLLTDQLIKLLTNWLNACVIDCVAHTHPMAHVGACTGANDCFARASMSKIYGFHLMPKMNGQVSFCVIWWRLAAVSPFVHETACAYKVGQRWREVGVVPTLTTETVALTVKLHTRTHKQPNRNQMRPRQLRQPLQQVKQRSTIGAATGGVSGCSEVIKIEAALIWPLMVFLMSNSTGRKGAHRA